MNIGNGIGNGIAIAGIWISVAIISFNIDGGAIIMVVAFAMVATLFTKV